MKKRSAILFYVFSGLFLIITIFLTVDSLIGLSKSASEYGVSMLEEWVTVLKTLLSTSGGFLGFAILFLGIGLVLSKLDK
ncbi:hypothetical protein AALI59_00865 [Thomasclavelia cocleata]|uniref:hypothetical protein n=1 Tax=Thomasclavelia cocleata TaxID=69824 RepID=UPI00248AD17F|nr:hypothetical protein [Thomasclavelia cocleata]